MAVTLPSELTVKACDIQLWGAARTLAMHATGGRCGRCQPDGSCGLYRWADEALKAWEAAHGRRYTEQAPRWEHVRDLRLNTRRAGS